MDNEIQKQPRKEHIERKFRHLIYNAFANPLFYYAQSVEVLWAIKEGVKRVPQLRSEFTSPKAIKNYQCMRGCEIKKDEEYFLSSEEQDNDKVCAPCMAMVLYFYRVWELPVFQYDYWDEIRQFPHSDERSEFNIAKRKAAEKLEWK